MKLVLFSDLHLDAAFGWLGRPEAARRRRDALRQTLARIVALAANEKADALLCAGDLYEHDRFTPDTMEFLKQAFASLQPVRVFLAPGNHDWYGPQSLYRRVAWSDNVQTFDMDSLRPVTLTDGLTLWGAAHRAPAGTAGFLRDFHVDRGGIHLALFHGSERSALREQEEGKNPHAPFEVDEIERAGLHHAFVGHYHTPFDGAWHTYPGNPEPLAFGETGTRGAVIVTVHDDGRIERERRHVAVLSARDVAVHLTGCHTRHEVAERIELAAGVAAGAPGVLRITLQGELAREIDLVPGDLARIGRDLEERIAGLEAVAVRFGDLRIGHDVDAIRDEATVRGQFVRDVLDSDLDPDMRRRVLVTGLRALDGRDDLEVP